MKIKVGKQKKMGSFVISFGKLELEITKTIENMTLKQIAKSLIKKYKITNGNMELFEITFSYRKQSEEK